MASCPCCKTGVQTPLKGLSPRCSSCGTALRSPLAAVLLSLALPGLGHRYLGRPALGALEMTLGFAVFMAGIVHMVIVWLAVVNETRPLLDILRVVLWWAPAIIGYGVLDASFTWLLSRHRVLASKPADPSPQSR